MSDQESVWKRRLDRERSARKQAAPDLLMLPISAPEASQ